MTGRAHACLLLVALLIAVGCGGLAGRGGVADLQGRTFLSTAVSEDGRPRPLVPGTRIRLSFPDDGRGVAAQAGCNLLGGDVRLEGGRLVVDDLVTTEMGCDAPRHSQDEWLAAFLLSKPTLRLGGPDLVLANANVEIRLLDREVADPDRPLVGTRWIVETIVDRDTASSTPRDADAHVILAGDGTFTGSTGCNLMGGSATTTSSTLAFSGVFTTKMACEPDRARLEAAVLAVIRDTVAYEIEADVLHLRASGGRGLDLRAVP